MPTLIERLHRWTARPSADRIAVIRRKLGTVFGLPFLFGRARAGRVILGWQPVGMPREFDSLFKRFTAHNLAINSGDSSRLLSLILNLRDLKAPGDFAEVGVWRGNTAAVLAHFAAAQGRRCVLFDTFEGFNGADIVGVDATQEKGQFSNTSQGLVRRVIGDNGSVCDFVPGYFPATFSHPRQYAAVSLDADLYEPTKAGLEIFWPLLSRGGFLFLHDYSSGGWAGSKKAIDEFVAETGALLVLMPDVSGSAFVRKP